MTEAGRRPFDLSAEALFQPTLLRLADDDHVLAIRTHHTVFDDWSVGVFRRELATLYGAFVRGQPSPLPELSLGFTAFARRQRRRLAGVAGARQAAFWRGELDGAPFTTQLPVDDPERAEGSPQAAGEPVHLRLPAPLHDRLQALAQGERATVFMTLLAAWGVLVHRYTGQDDLLLATVVANRNRTDLEGMIGCFTKKVPIRLRLSGDPVFTEVLSRTRTALLGALTHQDLPFEAVVQDVLGGPAAAHGLVPQPVLVFQGVTRPAPLDLPDVETAGLQTSRRTGRAHFMAGEEDEPDEGAGPPWGCGLYLGAFLILSVDESGGELTLSARGAFHASAVRGLLRSFRTLLADVTDDPTRRVSQLTVLDERGRAEARRRARGPHRPLPDTTCQEVLGSQVERSPGEMAVRTREEALTHAALDARSNALAHHLAERGVGPGATVGITLPGSLDAIVAVVAAWKAGAAWLGVDPHDECDRLERIIDEASLGVVVGRVPGGPLAGLVVTPPHAAAFTDPVGVVVPPDAPAVVFYGSGSSAVDSPVVVDHRGVLALREALRDLHREPTGQTEHARVCLSAPPTEDGFLRQLAALLDGHCLVVPDGGCWEALGAGDVDVVHCAPEDLDADEELHRALGDRPRGARRPTVVVAGRTGIAAQRWQTLAGCGDVRAHVLYGPPECGFAVTARTVQGPGSRQTVGLPLPNVSAHVLDARGEVVPPRALGRLHVAGAAGGHRLRSTGQLARSLPDGSVELLGPVEADTDLRGFRVDADRITGVLTRCPGVSHVAVELRRDERGEPRLAATVVPDGQAPTVTELRAFLWTHLPGYAWPCDVVVHASVPAGEDGAADETDEAAVLGSVWADVLGVERVEGMANYWQDFSFLEALDRARDVGLEVAGEQVTRNRTIDTLAADLAAARRRGAR